MNLITRFKIVALLVVQMDLPEVYQRKVDVVAQMIDKNSEYKLNGLMLLEAMVLDYVEKMELIEDINLN